MVNRNACLLIYKRFLFATLFLAGFETALAQSPVFQPYNPVRKNGAIITNAVFQDSKGFMWLGTDKGLFKFDGTVWQNYTVPPKDSVFTNKITAVAEDSLGHIWVGFDNGKLSTLDDGVFTLFETEEGSAVEAISEILFDKQGTLWYSTLNDGLYYVKGERTYRLDEDEGLPDTYVYDLLEDSEGKIWAGTDGGIAIIDLKGTETSIETIGYDQGLPDNIVRKLIQGDNDNIWLGTEDAGIIQYKKSTKKIVPSDLSRNWSYGPVTDISIKGDQLWIGTFRKGLIVLNTKNGQQKTYNRKNGFPSSGVRKLSIDNEGNVWLGSRNGIFRTPGDNIEFISDLSPLMDRNILALDVDGQGNIWFVTQEGFFRRCQKPNGSIQIDRFLGESKFSRMSFISVYVDSEGQVWIGTYGNGIIRFDPATGKSKHLEKELPNGNILNITGKDSHVWLATLGGGVKIDFSDVQNYKVDYYDKEAGLSTNYIYQVFIDSKGRTWFATDGQGISLMDEKGFTTFSKEQGLLSNVIYGFAEDRNGHIWVNTKGQGLYKYDGKKFESIDEKKGLRDLNIASILSNRNGNILVYHDLGIDVYDINAGRFNYIGESYGVNDQKANLNAITKDRNGHIFIGTDEGMIKFSSFGDQEVGKPTPYIDQVKLFTSDANYANVEEISFKHDENNLTINYIGFWYQDAQNLSYQYKLDNYEQDWINSRNRSVTYSSLPPGQYNFRLRVSKNNDFEGAQEASVSFYIRPPFWKTLPFYALVLISVVGLTYLFIKRREKKLKEDKRILEEKVEERTLEIKKQNQEIAKKNENITSSINYAKRIQQAILPLSDQIKSIFPEYFIFYKPRDIVSGDFYWMHCNGDIAYFAAIDCTGHGVPGAFMSLIGYSLLNGIVSNNPGINPAEILCRLDKGVINALKQEDEDGDIGKSYDGMDVALCSWDAKTRKLVFSGAKRPLYLINGSDELIEYKGDKMSIGGKKKGKLENATFTDKEIHMNPGSKVYLFSDGYPDQFGGPDNGKFMTKKLKRMILEHHRLSPEEQGERFGKMLDEWQSDKTQTDDILLAGLFF